MLKEEILNCDLEKLSLFTQCHEKKLISNIQLFKRMGDDNDNVKVAVRVEFPSFSHHQHSTKWSIVFLLFPWQIRPLIPKEVKDKEEMSVGKSANPAQEVKIGDKLFTFDHAFHSNVSQVPFTHPTFTRFQCVDS